MLVKTIRNSDSRFGATDVKEDVGHVVIIANLMP